MTYLRRIAARFSRSVTRNVAVLGLGAASVVAFSGAAQAGPYSPYPGDHDRIRCIAGAQTVIGGILPGTRAEATRKRSRRACGIALNRCEARLDDKRAKTGLPFPLARCKVLDRDRIAAVSQTRCEAKAFTRRGRALSKTHAAETRKKRRAACRVALNRCEARLDRKRIRDDRNYRYARCEVTKTKKVYAWRDRGQDFFIQSRF